MAESLTVSHLRIIVLFMSGLSGMMRSGWRLQLPSLPAVSRTWQMDLERSSSQLLQVDETMGVRLESDPVCPEILHRT